jgi:ribulose-phosphate 3-epimerase
VIAAGTDMTHFDDMDSHCVPNLTKAPLICEAIRPNVRVPINVHLMVKPVDTLAAMVSKAGADIISFHPDASEHLIGAFGCKAGTTLNPATPLHVIGHVIEKLNLIIVMSVNPRVGGQVFIPEASRLATAPDRVFRRSRPARNAPAFAAPPHPLLRG